MNHVYKLIFYLLPSNKVWVYPTARKKKKKKIHQSMQIYYFDTIRRSHKRAKNRYLLENE